MKLKNIQGRYVYKNCSKYLIDWEGKSRSKYQFRVKEFLQPFWEDRCIVYEEFPVYGSRMTVDFFNANKKIALEIQGEAHSGYIKHFHSNRSGYGRQLDRDRQKRVWAEDNEIVLVEIFPEDIDNLSRKWFREKWEVNI